MHSTPGRQDVPAPWWTAFVLPALGAALAACGTALAPGVLRDGPPAPEAVVGLLAAALGTAVVLCWAFAAGLAVLAVVAGRRRWERVALTCRRCSPAVLRRAAATALGVQLVAVPTASADGGASPFWGDGDDRAPVHAAPTAEPTPGPEDRLRGGAGAEGSGPDALAPPGPAPGSADVPAGGPDPGSTADRSAPAPSLAGRVVEGQVTVVRGDTLWSLAAAHLGPGATDGQIARCWPVWYELNRHVLTDGPHLLLPGQRLVVPDRGTPAQPPSFPLPPNPGGPS